MRGKLSAALEEEDDETLLLWWGAQNITDPGDYATWRAASPHWSADRERMLRKKFEAAQRGEVDPEADDPDPMASFVSQYLNTWNLKIKSRPVPGSPVVTEAVWDGLEAEVPDSPPDAVAVEGWFDQGLALVEAWNRGGIVYVRATPHPNAASAAAHAGVLGAATPLLVGKSLLATEPALRALWHESAQGTTANAARELGRLVSEGILRHDGGTELTEQVLALRVQPAPDGVRLVSKHRSDAVKALCWSVSAAKEVQESAAIF